MLFERRNHRDAHFGMMQNAARDGTKSQPAPTVAMMGSDHDKIDLVALDHLKQMTGRMSPGGFDSHRYVLGRQAQCNMFRQVALEEVLDLGWIPGQRHRSVIAKATRFVRRPIKMQHGRVTRTDLLQFIHPAKGGVTRGREES